MSHFLYKYFPLRNEKHLERVIGCLRGYIFFSSPLSFNDPFELATPIEKPSPRELIEFFNEKNQQHILEKPSLQRKLSKNIQKIWHREENILATDEWLEAIGVLCTTGDPRNLLMWAHYGSNHTGICLGFDKNEALFSDAKPVNYTLDRPTLAFSAHKEISDQDIQSIFFNKSKEWKYEKEWRCIKRKIKENEKEYYEKALKDQPDKLEEISEIVASNGGPGIYDIEKESIRRIYFGCKIKNYHKERIIKEIGSLKIQPKIFSLSLDKRHFYLEERKAIF